MILGTTSAIPELEYESDANFVNNFIQSYGHIAFALLATTDQNYKEAMKSNEKERWKESMKVEYDKFQREGL